MGKRQAGIYCRISQDRTGAGLGVERQRQDAQALCDRLGWAVTDVYSDNDVSAYSGKPRPEWRRLIADIEAGRVTAVACWHVDRLTRSPAELEEVITLADRHGVELATATGEIDLGTPTGRLVARILGATARSEVEAKGERQRRQIRQSAEAGRPNGGGSRPFGFAADRVTIDETEAEVIRDVAHRVLVGESLSSIVRDLAERGVETPTGGTWKPSTLRRLIASARISGRREHTPRSSSDSGTRPLIGEIVADAEWPAIITVEQSDRIRAILSDPARQRYSSATGRTYLLSGILRCAKCGPGDCGAGMVGRPKSGTPRYVCPATPGTGHCGGTATVAGRTDELVREMILDEKLNAGLARRLRRPKRLDPGLERAIRSDEKQLEELSSTWANGEITRSEWMTARDIVQARLGAARDQLEVALAAVQLHPDMLGTYDELRERWEAKSIAQQRAWVAALIDHIDVLPADPRKKWDPDRFDPVWRF